MDGTARTVGRRADAPGRIRAASRASPMPRSRRPSQAGRAAGARPARGRRPRGRPPRAPADAAEALVAVAPLAARWIERLLGGHRPPLTPPQYLALRAIAREPISVSDLARRAGVFGPAATQLVNILTDAHLVERRDARDDRRRQRLVLSRRRPARPAIGRRACHRAAHRASRAAPTSRGRRPRARPAGRRGGVGRHGATSPPTPTAPPQAPMS